MSIVGVKRCKSYGKENVKEKLSQVFDLIGGLEDLIHPGDKVLVKVNLLNGKGPSSAVTTHPDIVWALVCCIRDLGGIPIVGDSPGGVGVKASNIFKTSGIAEAAEDSGAELLIFETDDRVEIKIPDGEVLKKIKVPRSLVEADVLITAPKLKTHGFMLYTGAIKNQLGVIPGSGKADMHRVAPNPGMFAKVLVDIFQALPPKLGVMDAIVGMEGNGPSSGDPREIGLLLASRDCVSLDAICSHIIGFKKNDILTTQIAGMRNLGVSDLKDIELVGESLEDIVCKDFVLPSNEVITKIPDFLLRLGAETVSVSPFIERNKCTSCGLCIKSCPERAISKKPYPVIMKDKCSKCLCCHELCPSDAVLLQRGYLGRAISGLRRRLMGHKRKQ